MANSLAFIPLHEPPLLTPSLSSHHLRRRRSKLPPIPEEPIAKKKEQLFSDDFGRPVLGHCGADVCTGEWGAEGGVDAF